MRRTNSVTIAAAVLLGFALFGCGKQKQKNAAIVRTDQSTAVRFFYEPPGNDYFHTPLVFVVVLDKDRRLNTAPSLESGRTAFIRLSEMESVVGALTRLGLNWHISPGHTSFGPSIKLDRTGKMDLTVTSSDTTAIAELQPKAICAALSSLDTTLKTPRALWELKRFRVNYGCTVPGFNADAYPDHGP